MEELNMVNYIGVCTLEEDVFHVWKNVFYGSVCPNMSILEALTHTHTHTHTGCIVVHICIIKVIVHYIPIY